MCLRVSLKLERHIVCGLVKGYQYPKCNLTKSIKVKLCEETSLHLYFDRMQLANTCEFGTWRISAKTLLYAHVDECRWARSLILGLSLPLLSYFVYAQGELADAILAKIDLDGSCMPKSVFYRIATNDRPIIALITDNQRLLCFLYYYVGAKMDCSHASTLGISFLARVAKHFGKNKTELIT